MQFSCMVGFYIFFWKGFRTQNKTDKGAVNLSHLANRQANGLFAHPRSNVRNAFLLELCMKHFSYSHTYNALRPLR